MPQTRVKPKAKAQRRAPEPGLMLLGGSPVVLPQGKVTAAAWPEFALALIMEPAPAQLGVWLGRLEERLGVTDAHRTALESRSFSLAQRQEVERREGLEQAARSAQLQGQVRDLEHVERVAKIQASLARARAAAENPAGQSERQQRKAAKVARVQVVALTERLAELAQQERDQDRLYGEARETILIAKNRGDDVSAFEAKSADFARDEFGARILKRKRDSGRGQTYMEPVFVYTTALRARKLTGIEHAHDAGYLGKNWRQAERLHKIGVDYREAYEIAEGHAGGQAEGRGGGSSGPKAPQPRLVEAGERLADFRRALSQRQRDVLDMVCGEDLRVREAATRMAAHFETTAAALRDGLARAARSRADAVAGREDAGVASAGAHIAAISAALARIRL